MYEYIARKLKEASFGWPEEDDEFYDLVRFCFDKAKEYESINRKKSFDTRTNPYKSKDWHEHAQNSYDKHIHNQPWKDEDTK